MSKPSQPDVYFSKHLFRTGLECPTRLYYHAKKYPRNREALPFIAHYRYNKHQLTNLFRCSFPNGIQLDKISLEKAGKETKNYLKKDQVTLFDPVFIHERYLAKVPVLEKKGNEMTVFHIQTKAFREGKHSISHQDGRIYSKWRDYITDLAFRVHIIEKCHPEWNVNSFLVLPAKYSRAKTDCLQEVLKRIESGELAPQRTEIVDEDLLAILDVSAEINRLRSGHSFDNEPFKNKTFEEVLETLADLFYSGEKYPVVIGNKCKSCEFRIERDRVESGETSGFTECWNAALDEHPDEDYKSDVFELIGPGTNHWIERGIHFQEEVPDGEFYDLKTIQRSGDRINEKQRQSLQIMQAKGQDVPHEMVKDGLFKELQRWGYPMHFIDFEAGNYAVPARKGRKPYNLLVFQFSCHTLFEDGSWTHHEWMDDLSGTYPNYEMVRRLKEVPQINKGTLVQYSNFERYAMKTIRKELLREEDIQDAGELSDWLYKMIRRHDSSHSSSPYLADLSRLVKNFYYNHKMEDSLSIKDVLQSIMTVSPLLKELYSQPYNSTNYDSIIWWQQDDKGEAQSPYQLMLKEREGGVRRGTEAMVVYARLLSEDLKPADQAALKKALLRYCEVDTLAMLMIFQHWEYLMQQKMELT